MFGLKMVAHVACIVTLCFFATSRNAGFTNQTGNLTIVGDVHRKVILHTTMLYTGSHVITITYHMLAVFYCGLIEYFIAVLLISYTYDM